ncbi:MAG TPA: DNA primase [Patescibacteria group bacterium]|nr:DNA primase [Patescibacteria group bacterium]
MQDPVEEIKSRLDIVDVISDYIDLRQAGENFKAICPFHEEKTPSFFVSPSKQIWHCFGCGKGSDIFGFVQEIEGIDFPEALRILAKRAGVKVNYNDKEFKSQKTALYNISNLATKFYHKILLDSKGAKKARDYLKNRGLNEKIISQFKLGYVPDKWDTILNFLKNKNYKIENIEKTGLIVKRKDKNGYYDRFRNRIMFPIFDLYGQSVGFTGRIMPDQESKKIPKYINTPETDIYNKSKVLFGLDKAKTAIKKKDKVILVEGNMDVLTAHQAGTKNTICTSGTALTKKQINIIKRFTENVDLAFDLDTAGQAATKRSIDLLLKESMNVSVLKLKHGKDPADMINKNIKDWEKATKNPLPIMEYYFNLAFKNRDLSSTEDKKKATKVFLPEIAKLGDPVEKGLWIKKLSDKLDLSEVYLRDALQSQKTTPRKVRPKSQDNIQRTSPEKIAENFLGLLLLYPQEGKAYLEKTILEMFLEDRVRQVIKILKNKFLKKDKQITLNSLKKSINNKKLEKYIDGISFLGEKEFAEFDKERANKEFQQLYSCLKRKYLKNKMQELVQKLKQAEEQDNKEKINKLLEQINRLFKQSNN